MTAQRAGGSPFRASVTISALTAAARVVGFVRWIVLASTVGTTYLGNTYQSANWVPNILFQLTAGGLLSAVFVPTFVEEAELADDKTAGIVASTLTNVLLLGSIPVVAAAIVFGRPIMGLLTSAVADPVARRAEIELGAWFLRFFAPQIPLYLIGSVMTGILHAHRRFTIAAAAPLLSSLVVIAAYAGFALTGAGPGAGIRRATDTQLWILAGGTTLGVVVLTFCQLPSTLRVGVRWRPVVRIREPRVRIALRRGAWGLAYFGITQVGLLVTLLLANRVRGGVVGWEVGFRFFEIAPALIGVPVATALFPSMARAYLRSDEPEFVSLFTRGWRAVGFLAVPAAAGLFVLARPLTDVLLGFGRGAAASLVAGALTGLAVGVPAYALSETVTRSFWARHRTSGPVAVNAVAMGLYALAAIALTVTKRPSGAYALLLMGAAFAIAQWGGLATGVALLARHSGWKPGRDVAALLTNCARAAAMGAVVWVVARALRSTPLLALAGGALAGVAVYAALSWRSPDLRAALGELRRRGA